MKGTGNREMYKLNAKEDKKEWPMMSKHMFRWQAKQYKREGHGYLDHLDQQILLETERLSHSGSIANSCILVEES